MSSPRYAKTIESACDGDHLAIWGLAGQAQIDAVLTALLAEREVRGSRVPVVSLLMRSREDGEWIERAITWLSARGRRVIVRTRVVMPRAVVSALAQAHRGQTGAIVELELAHHKPAIQRALLSIPPPLLAIPRPLLAIPPPLLAIPRPLMATLPSSTARAGDEPDPAAALLLQAQHLETLELPVVARLAPLLPGVHDQPSGFTPLLRNLVAADVRHVVVEPGHLHSRQLRKLIAVQRELSVQSLIELARAYSVDPMVVLGGAKLESDDVVYKLKPRRAQVFAHGLEHLAREHDRGALKLPSCGCRSHCELMPGRASNGYGAGYESVMGRDLFAGLI